MDQIDYVMLTCEPLSSQFKLLVLAHLTPTGLRLATLVNQAATQGVQSLLGHVLEEADGELFLALYLIFEVFLSKGCGQGALY